MIHAQLLDGKALAQTVLEEIAQKPRGDRPPGIAFVLVGDDAASHTYVKMKQKRADELGYYYEIVHLPESVSTQDLVSEIETLNGKEVVDGIIVQQPLPKQIDLPAILTAVDPRKDIDGFHPVNLGKLVAGDESGFVPCTPRGVVRLIEQSGISLSGKEVVVIGRSLIVGKPLSILLGRKAQGLNATVTLAHSGTSNLPEIVKRADVIVAAVGVPGLIQKEMVKPGAVVIDVGVNRLESDQLVGDVDFAGVAEVASYITPVPGGVGPMTIAMLLENTYEAYACNQL